MMDANKFENLKAFIKTLIGKYSVQDLVIEVHNLYQEWLISENQEVELYYIVDPDDEIDNPSELWYNTDGGCKELYTYAFNL